MPVIFLLPLLLAGVFAMWGCAVEPEATLPLEAIPSRDIEATVEAAVSATLTASSPKSSPHATVVPGATKQHPAPTEPPRSTPSPTAPPATPTPAPTVPPATPTPAPTVPPATPTPAPTVPPATPTPAPTVPPATPTPAPTVPPVDSGERIGTVTTSLGRQVNITVSGFDNNALRFDQLVLSINEGERLLGVPYPSPSVAMLRVNAVKGGFCGLLRPKYAPRYVSDPYTVTAATIEVRVDNECTETFATIAHEVAHTWFHGSSENANWIDEGLANAIELQVVAANQDDQAVYPPVTYCESYRNISELERGNPPRVSDDPYTGFRCNYSLGDGVFWALREHHGDSAFNQRIAQLARRSTSATKAEHTVGDIRRVLGDDANALAIINLWYEGQPEMRHYRHLDAVEWSFPPTIDGDYLHFAGKTREPGLVHGFLLGDDPFCSQFTLYRNEINQELIASVSDPLPVGWSYREVPEFVVINDSIDPTTGEFSVTARVNVPGLSEIPGLSLLVRSRETVGEDRLCGRGDSYSQVAISGGVIPAELKKIRHYQADVIQWSDFPAISGTTLSFAGTAEPGMINLEWRDGYCGQFKLYRRDQRGYHYIDSLAPLLPDNKEWSSPQPAEFIEGWTYTDGKFNATARLSSDLLAQYSDLILVVSTPAALDPTTRLCGDSEVISAIDIQRR